MPAPFVCWWLRVGYKGVGKLRWSPDSTAASGMEAHGHGSGGAAAGAAGARGGRG